MRLGGDPDSPGMGGVPGDSAIVMPSNDSGRQDRGEEEVSLPTA